MIPIALLDEQGTLDAFLGGSSTQWLLLLLIIGPQSQILHVWYIYIYLFTYQDWVINMG